MDHPILNRIRQEGFTPFGWFVPDDVDGAKFAILIGNAGPAMFRRFQREAGGATLDDWTKLTVDRLAQDIDAKALYPFSKPYHPFQHWARQCGIAHASPLALNIHPTYGLWHAYRALLTFTVQFDVPRNAPSRHPCETCVEKPCLSACPVSAFSTNGYDIAACTQHLHGENSCMESFCNSRLACPIGTAYRYEPSQKQFHMKAFKKAHAL